MSKFISYICRKILTCHLDCDTFDNHFGSNPKFMKCLKEICGIGSNQISPSKFVPCSQSYLLTTATKYDFVVYLDFPKYFIMDIF